jgi:NAD(P)-dependent dehydrogenase (short-subunit alcohol dehydrogenase family)
VGDGVKELRGRVAVVTGASTGIGRAIARAFAREGMCVVLASQNPERLEAAAVELRSLGGPVLAVPTDVSDRDAVFRLARAALDAFGAVHVLVNNAGVWVPGYSWEVSQEEWEWVVGVNLWGTVYGLQAFLPHLLEQPEAHVVNVASVGGLMAAPVHSPYSATKHAVVGLSKGLRLDLSIKGASVGVTLVCPGAIRTSIMSQPWRTGPGGRPRGHPELAPEVQAVWDAIGAETDAGIPAEEVGPMVVEAIRNDRFWLLPNGERFFEVFERELEEIEGGV